MTITDGAPAASSDASGPRPVTPGGTLPAPLSQRPGKIVAVHVSYASRAAERGRHPEAPSYFFKPSSSIAATNGVAEIPDQCSQLAFEGEVALVIGTLARRVPLADAWRHVAWVTAANDFGVAEFRPNDAGSNVRAKGRDGYTPLGPALLDASALDPNAIRVRTWVNGQPAQDETTAGLLFSPARIIADLSQHLTLEPGDVILTGTPAGTRVVVPGDVVEVEVDAPTAPDAPTTGRLTTTITASTEPFDPTLGSLPTPIRTPFTLTDDLRAVLEQTPTAGLSAQLRKRGLNNVVIEGPRPLTPDGKIIGTARTLRYLPNREDLFERHGGGYNAQKRTFDAVNPGEVIVIEARGETGAATLGDVLAQRARTRGAAGIVTDGCVRDAEAVAQILPVFAAGNHPAVLGRRHIPWEADVAIGCGGATVQPGDVIVADADGVVVIPPAIAAEVAQAALDQEHEDAWVAERVAEGNQLDGLFPMNAEWRARYAQWRRTQ